MTLDGWKAIGAHLARLGCPERDRTTLWRWAQLPDPLPVYAVRGGAEKGGRILAEAADVEAWWRRIVRIGICLTRDPTTTPAGTHGGTTAIARAGVDFPGVETG